MPDATRLSRGEFLVGVRIIAVRELEACFDSPIAYIYSAVFLVLSSAMFMNTFFLAAVVDMSAYFEILPYLLIPFAAAITMRTWSEEMAQGTLELLLTLPFRPFQVVLGKYLATLCFYAFILLGSLPIVIMLVWLGDPDGGLILSSYLGALFLGAFFLAFGLFASCLSRDQIVAFVLAVLLGSVFVLSGHDKVVEVVDGFTPGWQLGTWLCESVSAMPHYRSFGRGILGAGDVLYFVLMSAFFLWMNEIALQRSKF